MSYVLSPAWHPGLLRRNLHSGDKTQSASRLQSEFGFHVPRCPLLCSLLIPPQPLPISPHCVLITWHFSLINCDRYSHCSPLYFLAHFSFRFVFPLKPTNNWVLLDRTSGAQHGPKVPTFTLGGDYGVWLPQRSSSWPQEKISSEGPLPQLMGGSRPW